MAGLNIDQILRDLERQKTAEEIFADGLQEPKAVEVVPEVVPEPVPEVVAEPVAEVVPEVVPEVVAEPVAEVVPEVVAEPVAEVVAEEVVEKTAEAIELEKLAEMEKEAAELDAKGRIMARGFMSELQKLASAVELSGEEVIPETAQIDETEKVAEDSRVWILTELYKTVYNQ